MDFLKVLKYTDLFAAHQREECPNMPDYTMHVHDYYELYVFLDGNVEFCVETNAYPLQTGDIVLTRPGEAHFARVDPNGPYERLYFQFQPKLLRETLNGKLLTPFLEHPLGVFNHYSADSFPLGIVSACIQQIFRDSSGSQMRALAFLLPILQLIYDCWLSAQHTAPPEAPSALPTRIISYINQHLYELRNPQQLAKQFYISESQLNRVFRSFTGSSVWEYIRLKRLFAAREMIWSGTLPHKAASTCGYSEYSTFFRAYKKQFGRSPKTDYDSNQSQ